MIIKSVKDKIIFKKKMKIQILSDLHLEFLYLFQVDDIISKILPLGDVLVLAGDIGRPDDDTYNYFLKKMSKVFPKVFIITGNHEYYGGDISLTNEKISRICSQLENVSFLCSSYEDYGGFRWIGTTLWTHIEPTTSCFINDVRNIHHFNIEKYNQLHQESVHFLENNLSEKKQLIVITHHLPSYKLIHKKYMKSPAHEKYNQWFASSLDGLIRKFTQNLPLWIYGHTHDFSHIIMNETQMICNPIGYENENKNSNWNYIVEI